MAGQALIDLVSKFMGMTYDEVAVLDAKVGGLFVSRFLQRRLSDALAGKDDFTREAFAQFLFGGLYIETDPTNERANIVPGFPAVNHSYPNSVTLNVTRTCHVKCTYCFRGDIITSAQSYDATATDAGITWIRQNPNVGTVVVTGGDPFTLPPYELRRVVDALVAIPTVNEIRLDTRALTVKPSSVSRNDEVLGAFRRAGGKIWLYSQINSAAEFHPDVDRAIKEVQRTGVPIINQAVILGGVNDQPRLMREMIIAGIKRGIKTDYLYLLDGDGEESQFKVPDDIIRRILSELWTVEVSGLAKPRAVYVDPLTNTKAQLLVAPLTTDNEYLLDLFLAERKKKYERAVTMRIARH